VLLVCRFARALALARRLADAASLLACAPVRFEELGVQWRNGSRRSTRRPLELVRRELDDGAFERAQDEGRRLSADDAAALALAALDE
jgi:hypothetical protein